MSARVFEAQPTKLRNGTWGARVSGLAEPGDRININARNGKRWGATVRRVFWVDEAEGLSIVSADNDRAKGGDE